MAEKLYLIRINLESFIGPMSMSEVKKAFKRMDFGLQDEIAGSNREWVAFDDLPRIKRYYPEFFDWVRKDMLAGWGKTEAHMVRIDSGESKRSSSSSSSSSTKGSSRRGGSSGSSDSRRRSSNGGKSTMFLLMALVGLVTFLVVRYGELPTKLIAKTNPLLGKAIEYTEEGNLQKFDAHMEKNLPEILEATRTEKGALTTWLPYLRAYAFHGVGKIDGLDPRYLLGSKAIVPKDCSLDSWKNRWRGSVDEWRGFMDGTMLTNKEWNRVLLWDPYWLRSRTPQKGWIDPGSAYEACLLMASRALSQVDVDSSRGELRQMMQARLNWILRQLNDSSGGQEFSMSGSIWVLSCFESADKMEALHDCMDGHSFDKEWSRLMQGRLFIHRGRILTSTKTVKPAQLDVLKTVLEQTRPVDPYTGFDYQPELRLFQQVLSNGGKVSAARSALRVKYPEFYVEP